MARLGRGYPIRPQGHYQRGSVSAGATDTALAGSLAWSGVAALSAAAIVGLAATGAITWSGVRASSTSDVVHQTPVA